MQISKKQKENKENNITSNSLSSSQIALLNSDKPNRYLQQMIKQNSSFKQLSDNFNQISNKSISNIHSIFSSDERKKQVMNMVKKMREKQNVTNKKNNEKMGSIQIDSNSDLFEKNTKILQRSSSVDKGNKAIFIDEQFNKNKQMQTQRNFNDYIDKNNSIDYSKGGNFYQQYATEIPIKLNYESKNKNINNSNYYENKYSNKSSNNKSKYSNNNENLVNKSNNNENKLNNNENRYSNKSTNYENRNSNKSNNHENQYSNNPQNYGNKYSNTSTYTNSSNNYGTNYSNNYEKNQLNNTTNYGMRYSSPINTNENNYLNNTYYGNKFSPSNSKDKNYLNNNNCGKKLSYNEEKISNNHENNRYAIDNYNSNNPNPISYNTIYNNTSQEIKLNNYDNISSIRDSKISKNSFTPVYQRKNLKGDIKNSTPAINNFQNKDNYGNNQNNIDQNLYYEEINLSFEIEHFKISIYPKKKRKKICKDGFHFSIRPKKKKNKDLDYIIESNNLNIIHNESNKNNISQNDFYSGIKLIQFDNGENIFEINLDGSINCINEKLEEEGVLINEKEFKIYDEEMLNKEKEKAIEENLEL